MKVWVGALTLLGGAAAFQSSFRYESEDLGFVEIAGVCSVSTEEVSCWDPMGKPSAKITELANAHFLVNSNNEMRLRFKKRNRLIVVRSVRKQEAKASFSGELESAQGLRTNQAGNIGYDSGQESYKLFWYYPMDDEKTVDLSSYLGVQIPSGVSLPVKEGAEGKLGGFTIKIQSIDEATANETMNGPNYGSIGKTWKIAYAVTGSTDEELPYLNPSPLNSKGQPILAVDKDGNPTKPPKPDALGNMRYQYPLVGGYSGSAKTGVFFSKIKPEKIAQLFLSGSTRRRISFRNIALDPSP